MGCASSGPQTKLLNAAEGAVEEATKSGTDALHDFGEQAKDSITHGVDNMKDAMGNAVNTVEQGISSAMGTIGDSLGFNGSSSPTPNALDVATASLVDQTSEAETMIASEVEDMMDQALKETKTITDSLDNAASDLKAQVDDSQDAVDDMMISDNMENKMEDVGDTIENGVDEAVKTIDEVVENCEEKMENVTNDEPKSPLTLWEQAHDLIVKIPLKGSLDIEDPELLESGIIDKILEDEKELNNEDHILTVVTIEGENNKETLIERKISKDEIKDNNDNEKEGDEEEIKKDGEENVEKSEEGDDAEKSDEEKSDEDEIHKEIEEFFEHNRMNYELVYKKPSTDMSAFRSSPENEFEEMLKKYKPRVPSFEDDDIENKEEENSNGNEQNIDDSLTINSKEIKVIEQNNIINLEEICMKTELDKIVEEEDNQDDNVGNNNKKEKEKVASTKDNNNGAEIK